MSFTKEKFTVSLLFIALSPILIAFFALIFVALVIRNDHEDYYSQLAINDKHS
jgi:hypothetical protein